MNDILVCLDRIDRAYLNLVMAFIIWRNDDV